MEYNRSLEELCTFIDNMQIAGADRNTVELAQRVLAVIDSTEVRLDVIPLNTGSVCLLLLIRLKGVINSAVEV